MFNIVYETSSGTQMMQELDSTNRFRLAKHLARFQRPILAVYEQATPITLAMRAELKKKPGTLSNAARKFAYGT